MNILHKQIKTKYIIILLVIVIFWQFTFPQTTIAKEEVMDFTSSINSKFTEQWTINYNANLNRLPVNPDKPILKAKKVMKISVTAYSSTPDQTSGDPFITASGNQVKDGVIAANFLPLGTKVRFPDYFSNKIFIVEDRMSARYWYKADIWMSSRQEAKEWGVKYTTIEIL